MDLNQEEIQELQEKIILIYKYIKQELMFERFFFEGINVKKSFKIKNQVVNTILQMEDPLEFLKDCIIELEELKTGKNKVNFQEIINSQDTDKLYSKYGMRNQDDIDKLDIKYLLEFL